jgi:hypothetical protein
MECATYASLGPLLAKPNEAFTGVITISHISSRSLETTGRYGNLPYVLND